MHATHDAPSKIGVDGSVAEGMIEAMDFADMPCVVRGAHAAVPGSLEDSAVEFGIDLIAHSSV